MVVDLSEKARAFLQELRFAVLATINQDGTPQLTTMWYLLEDDGTILMNTKLGRLKERSQKANARAVLERDTCEPALKTRTRH